MLEFEVQNEGNAKIIVVGVGGGGCNAVNRMIESNLDGVEFIAINTDKQALNSALAETKLQIGAKLTKGLGAGGNPETGQRSAEENQEDISNFLEGADMVFVTAGMGGGTGTGAAPIVAKTARDKGILTVAVVSKPFAFEGRKRMENAERGIQYLKDYVDAIVIVPNEKLFNIAEKNTTIKEAFSLADQVLCHGVQGITDMIKCNGLINLDFADVQTVMRDRGVAHMGIGIGSGENRVKTAIKSAVESPLLETTVAGAKAILLNITGGYSLGLMEVHEAGTEIETLADSGANIIVGTAIKEEMEEEIQITVIATGFENQRNDFTVVAGLQGEGDADSSQQTNTTSRQTLSEILRNLDEDAKDGDFVVPTFLNKK